jgi:hypothetical protein
MLTEKNRRGKYYGYITMVAGMVSRTMQWELGAYICDSD